MNYSLRFIIKTPWGLHTSLTYTITSSPRWDAKWTPYPLIINSRTRIFQILICWKDHRGAGHIKFHWSGTYWMNNGKQLSSKFQIQSKLYWGHWSTKPCIGPTCHDRYSIMWALELMICFLRLLKGLDSKAIMPAGFLGKSKQLTNDGIVP